MNLLKIFTIIVSLLYFSIPSSNPSQTNLSSQGSTFYQNANDNWVMEFHDSSWWWVLYDEDGSKIMEIPIEF
jgi:ABC-type phosphate transport system substrate-binding protein